LRAFLIQDHGVIGAAKARYCRKNAPGACLLLTILIGKGRREILPQDRRASVTGAIAAAVVPAWRRRAFADLRRCAFGVYISDRGQRGLPSRPSGQVIRNEWPVNVV
jgi:hypothetical protein